jgi:hypothetical protein
MFVDDDLCIDAVSDLVDSGTDLGYDMRDFSALDYQGAAPEVGARESGVSREYGGVPSVCP